MSNLAVIVAAESSGGGSFLVSPNVGLMIVASTEGISFG